MLAGAGCNRTFFNAVNDFNVQESIMIVAQCSYKQIPRYISYLTVLNVHFWFAIQDLIVSQLTFKLLKNQIQLDQFSIGLTRVFCNNTNWQVCQCWHQGFFSRANLALLASKRLEDHCIVTLLCDLNCSVWGRVSSWRTSFWTPLNLNSEVSNPKYYCFHPGSLWKYGLFRIHMLLIPAKWAKTKKWHMNKS